jgi:predicted phosphodiesterase
MKRQLESSDDESDRITKRVKVDENTDTLFPAEVLQVIVRYTCHNDVISTVALLQSAKLFEEVLDEENWKLLYVFHWHRKILGENCDNSDDVMDEIENFLNTNPNDYVEEQFFDKKNAWKNRYLHRSQMERDKAKLEDDDQSTHPDDLLKLHENSVAVYRTYNDYGIVYGNVDKIEDKNKQSIMAIQNRRGRHRGGQNFEYIDEDEYPLEDNCRVYQAIIIGHTGAPVKVRVETVDVRNFGAVEKMYCNTRVLAFDVKNQAWNVFVAHYSNYAVEEDEINYYRPYCDDIIEALFAEKKEGRDKRGTSDMLHHDLFKIVATAAEVSEDYLTSNTDSYIILD